MCVTLNSLTNTVSPLIVVTPFAFVTNYLFVISIIKRGSCLCNYLKLTHEMETKKGSYCLFISCLISVKFPVSFWVPVWLCSQFIFQICCLKYFYTIKKLSLFCVKVSRVTEPQCLLLILELFKRKLCCWRLWCILIFANVYLYFLPDFV